jgi:hypothetical protein
LVPWAWPTRPAPVRGTGIVGTRGAISAKRFG